ncbi:MAG: hypothetical protein ACYDG4_14725 [Desulfuromonadaceae bacterium]
MKKIWVDLDGVLCDFDRAYKELHGIAPKEAGFSKERWLKFIEASGFANLEFAHGAQELIHCLEEIEQSGKAHVFILSSSGGLHNHGEVQRQKLAFLKKHDIGFHPMIVPGRRYKKGFADSSSILIDDHSDNVDDFIKAGGYGILHESKTWLVTINLLDEWMKNGD